MQVQQREEIVAVIGQASVWDRTRIPRRPNAVGYQTGPVIVRKYAI